MASDAEQAVETFYRECDDQITLSCTAVTPEDECDCQENNKARLLALIRSREQAAYREGQERMRERAAEFVRQKHLPYQTGITGDIRSLPIEDKEER